jgi:ribosomal protein S18 acetylase RimI-like enzyme
LTQRELGLKLGYEERNADVRIAQYESGYRVPKKDTLMEIARILNVNYINFITEAPGCAEDIMQTFFWLDEDNRNTFHLFQLVRNPSKCNASDDKSVRYNDGDEWPAHAPVGMWIDYGHIDDETPSLAISLYKEYRGRGIGTEMMKEMLSLLKTHNYKRVSLSVQKANYAAEMYRKIGFDIVRENEEEWIMICNL